jgi:hypothetical protein
MQPEATSSMNDVQRGTGLQTEIVVVTDPKSWIQWMPCKMRPPSVLRVFQHPGFRGHQLNP